MNDKKESQWIDVFEPKTGRKSSLSFGGRGDMPGTLRIVGVLSHGSEITFHRASAEKLVKFLQENILNVTTIKTKDQWDASKKTLSEFLTVGDEVDEMMADYFLGVLPPACMSSTCIQIGEPYSHDDNDRPMFSTLTKAGKGCNWVYAGVMVTPKGEKNCYIE